MTSTVQKSDEGTVNWIPDGCVVIIGADDQCYVVPEFCVLALDHIFDGYWRKEEMEVFEAAGSEFQLSYHVFNSTDGFPKAHDAYIECPI